MVEQEISMVERVAKSICCEDGCEFPSPSCLACERGSPWQDTAIAVLKAMRVPTQAMICAVLDAHDRAPRTTRAIEDWQTMIDEALKPREISGND
jgi:hypothetical protein